MLFLIGLGLGDEKDITVKGLEAVRSCSRVFLEAYTSVLGVSREKLEAFYGRPIEVADREFIESEADKSIIAEAAKSNVAVLVVGDPFGYISATPLKYAPLRLPVQPRTPTWPCAPRSQAFLSRSFTTPAS